MDEGERPEEFSERQALSDMLQRALQSLPDDQRTVIVLSDVQGMQYNEISETLGVSLGTVKSRLNRGRRKLRDFMRENEELLPARYRLQYKGGGVAGAISSCIDWISDCFVSNLMHRRTNRYD